MLFAITLCRLLGDCMENIHVFEAVFFYYTVYTVG